MNVVMPRLRRVPSGLRSPAGFRFWAGILLLGLASFRTAGAAPRVDLEVLQGQGDGPWDPREPLAIRVWVRHPATVEDGASPEPVRLSLAGRPWMEAVSLALRAPDGAVVPLPWRRSGSTSTTPLTLLEGGEGALAFLLAGDPNRSLAEGRHVLVATLNVAPGEGDGWQGRSDSEPVPLEVANPTPSVGGLRAEVVGAEALSPGDPWVLRVTLGPPLNGFSSDLLRSGYSVTVRDGSGRDLGWRPEPAGTPPELPPSDVLADSGLSPVLVTIPRETTAGVAPGTYAWTVRWRRGATGPEVSGEGTVTVLDPGVAAAHPGRGVARLQQGFAEATALLWRAEFASSAEIQTLVDRAVPVLLDVERGAFQAYAAEPRRMESGAVVAEALLLGGDFGGARAFARVARRAWVPETATPVEAEGLGVPIPPEALDDLDAAIEARSARPGRVLPTLTPALVRARGYDPADPASLAPSEGAWATEARASSEYGTGDYGAVQATGAANITSAGTNRRAWAPRQADTGEEWLELTYATPIRASGVRVFQSFNPGTVMRIEVGDGTGPVRTVWTGPDTSVYPSGRVGILEVRFPVPDVPVARVRVVLDTRRVPGWNEIDAVALLAAPPVEVLAPRLEYVAGAVGAGGVPTLRIPSWPDGFRLERATRWNPSDWTPVATNPPVSLPMEQAAEFLRLRTLP